MAATAAAAGSSSDCDNSGTESSGSDGSDTGCSNRATTKCCYDPEEVLFGHPGLYTAYIAEGDTWVDVRNSPAFMQLDLPGCPTAQAANAVRLLRKVGHAGMRDWCACIMLTVPTVQQ
jgi:hypothetical protein